VIRRISLTVVLVVGVVWVAATFVFGLWSKAPAADHLTNNLNAAFTPAAIAQEHADAVAVNRVATDLSTTTVPLVGRLTHASDAQAAALLATTWPTVGRLLSTRDDAGRPFANGQTYVQNAADYVTAVAGIIQAERPSFLQAEQIPIKSLPAQALTWLFVILGLVTLAIGGVFIWKPDLARPLGAALVALGLVVVAVTLIINVPGKTQSVDNVTNAFRPVFATSGPLSIDQGQRYLTAVGAADQTLSTQLVPTLATLLDTTPGNVTGVLSTNDPVLVNALFGRDAVNPQVSPLRGILQRWDGLAAVVVSQRSNFSKVDAIPGWGMPATMVQFLLVVPALLLVLAGIGWIVPPLGKPHPVATYGHPAAT
jgi:hypothetical protein